MPTRITDCESKCLVQGFGMVHNVDIIPRMPAAQLRLSCWSGTCSANLGRPPRCTNQPRRDSPAR
eukprot:3748973-Rhodomonas_salina.1